MLWVQCAAIRMKDVCVFGVINRENASQKKTWCDEQKNTTEIFENAISLM